MNLDIVSASAGTGKTFTLAKRLFELLDGGHVQPEGVVAITYTVKAAGELESRIRKRLLESGKAELAARIRDGYIGTIHSVCQRLAREFALDAGLSPLLEPVPEEERRKLLAVARAGVLRGREGELNRLAERLAIEDWGEPLRNIIDAARQNGLDATAVRVSAEKSGEGLRRLLGTPTLNGDTYFADLQRYVAAMIPKLAADAGSGDAAVGRLNRARRLLGAFRAGRASWCDQIGLAKAVKVGKLDPEASNLRNHVARHLECKAFHEDMRAFQTLLFEVAAETLDAFTKEKATARVVDFGDMLALAHDLLGRPSVQAVLRDRLDLVLVDEVQDTSPLQLAVVTALGKLARRSIWVGDKKQAIFGFQGSDPELMTAALDAVLKDRTPEILGKSYRSRPSLVDFASELFAGVFAQHGIPREQVVLVPEKPDPAGLKDQPSFACWRWTSPGRTPKGQARPSEAHAIADAVQKLLAARPAVQVRNRVENGPDLLRAATPRDIAVLAYRNSRCSEIATALRLRGIPARVATSGLTETPEGRLARAALALVADPADGVAAMEVSWLAGTGADDPDGWLARHVGPLAEWRKQRLAAGDDGTASLPPRPEPFADDPRVLALRAAAEQAGPLSPTEAFDLALRAGGLPEVVRGWPEPGQVMANLEALRAEAKAYEELCQARRIASTVLGLVEHLAALADEADQDSDRQAMPASDDAVTVSTWFRSKGLEWPIVILSELNFARDRNVFDVATVAAPEFRFEAPLADRWVRHWPWPYGSNSQDLVLADRAAGSQEGIEAEARATRERLRLLYVAFTRPRDLLALVTEVGKNGPKTQMLDPLKDEHGAPRVVFPFEAEPGAAELQVGKRRWPCSVAAVSPLPPKEPVQAAGAMPWYAAGPRFAAPREVVNPSAEPLDVLVRVKSVTPLAGRVTLKTRSDMQAVGDAIHSFLAADMFGDAARRCEIAKRLLDAHDVAVSLSPETLIAASDVLRTWVGARWAGATWHREWPLRAKLAGDPPRLLVGEADLVLELPNGFIVIDHKSFPGSAGERDRKLVSDYGPQLGWYAQVLRDALKKPLLGAFIHFPVRGEMAELELGASSPQYSSSKKRA